VPRSSSPHPRLLSALLLGLLMMVPAVAPPAAADEPMKPHRLHVPSREGELDATLWVRDAFSISAFAALPGTPRIIAEAPTGVVVGVGHTVVSLPIMGGDR